MCFVGRLVDVGGGGGGGGAVGVVVASRMSGGCWAPCCRVTLLARGESWRFFCVHFCGIGEMWLLLSNFCTPCGRIVSNVKYQKSEI